MDQALGLRKKAEKTDRWNTLSNGTFPLVQHPIRVMSVSSGKGGVGKSNMVINLAMSFAGLGRRVLILDADLGLANIDVLLGLTPRYNISHILGGQKKLKEVLVPGPGNVLVMPASSGVQELTNLSEEQKLLFLEMLDELESEIDILLIDTGAGISDTVLYFNLAAHEKIIVVTPEPTSLTDAYALIKVLYTRHGERHFKVLANSVRDEKMGKSIFAKISKVADHFLDGLSLDYLGSVPHDPNITKAVINQRALMEMFPDSPASRALMSIAGRILKNPPQLNQGNIQFFWKRLLGV